VGPRAGLDDVEKRKFLTLVGLELRRLGRPARSAVAIPTALPGSAFKSNSFKTKLRLLNHIHVGGAAQYK
jgi:hypothetical protein